MKVSVSRNAVGFALLVLFMILSVSYEAMGQGRSRRANRWRWNDKKCAKFVNCHDARDGRLDGRGPNRRRDIDDRIFRRNRRHRDRDRDWDGIRNRRDRDRDWDGITRKRRNRDRDWDRVMRNRRNRDRDFDRDPFRRGRQ